MMRTALLVAVLVAVALAEEGRIRPTTKATCVGDRYKWVDQSSLYAAGSPNAAGCLFTDYETECTEIQGLTACDTYDSVCTQYKGDETWKAEKKASAGDYIGADRPWKCVREGAFWFPDSRVVAVAQVIVTIAFIIYAVLVALMSCKSSVNIVAIAALVLMVPVSIILSFSYYYLNAIIVVAGTIGAIGLFSEKNAVFGATGMILGLVTLFWVTYDAGLGMVQHHSRRLANNRMGAGTSTMDTYENGCNNYYRGYFQNSPVRFNDDQNPAILFGGYCGRSLLAGFLFVMIFLELLLILAVAAGVSQLGLTEAKTIPEEATREVVVPAPVAELQTQAF